MRLPETTLPAEIYYDKKGTQEYIENSRIQQLQYSLAERCIEISEKTEGVALDIGCGPGTSSQALIENDFLTIGLDISKDMLDVFDGTKVLCDMGNGLPFLPGSFDLIISVSAVQWLFESYRKEDLPIKRIKKFFKDLYTIIKRDGKIVLQFYCNPKQTEILKKEALNAGFYGGLIIDGKSKNTKTYLLLQCVKIRNENEEKEKRKDKFRNKK